MTSAGIAPWGRWERWAPQTAALGALADGAFNLQLLSAGLLTAYFYPAVDYVLAVLILLLVTGAAPALGALLGTTCFHPRQIPFGPRVRAALGAGGASLLHFVATPWGAWLLLAPLVAGLAVRHAHLAREPEEAEPLPAGRVQRALLVLGLLVLYQVLATAGRGGPFVLLFLPFLVVPWGVGSSLLALVVVEDRPKRRRTDLWAGLLLHAIPLALLLGYAFGFALPWALAGDFVLRDYYYGTTVVDYTLAADPVLAVLLVSLLGLYLRTVCPAFRGRRISAAA